MSPNRVTGSIQPAQAVHSVLEMIALSETGKHKLRRLPKDDVEASFFDLSIKTAQEFPYYSISMSLFSCFTAPTPMSSRGLPRPNLREIPRYRYRHSPRIGSIFVLDNWLHGSRFESGAAGSLELDAVVSSIASHGLDNTRETWEAHWSSALSDDELHWLSESATCTSIRLPIGYFTLGPPFCTGTPFATLPAQVYVNAWTAVKKLVGRCVEHGIGVLLDIHAAPRDTKSEIHSEISGDKTKSWGHKFNLDLLIACLCFVAQEVVSGHMRGIIGVQLVNEAQWDPPGMYEFYDEALRKIAAIDPTLPVYISDGWDLRRALKYAQSKKSLEGEIFNPVIVDTHRYYTFAERRISCSPQKLITELPTELNQLDGSSNNVYNNTGAVDVLIGQYGCTLAPQAKRSPKNIVPSLPSDFDELKATDRCPNACNSIS